MEPHLVMGETNSSSSNEMRNLQKNQGSALANPSLHWKENKMFTYETLLFLMGPVFHLGDCTSIFFLLKVKVDVKWERNQISKYGHYWNIRVRPCFAVSGQGRAACFVGLLLFFLLYFSIPRCQLPKEPFVFISI